MITQKLFVFCDGGARGNPGPAAIAFIVKDNRGKVLAKVGKYIGRATNNVAEYQAVIEALQWIISNIKARCAGFLRNDQISNIQFFLDSQLIVNQLNGRFKIKNSNLQNLIIKVRKKELEINGVHPEGLPRGGISYYFIPRRKNHQADLLVNQTLNKKIF